VTPSGRVLGLSAKKIEGVFQAGTPYDAEVLKSASDIGAKLYQAGYRGPFGIDAFSYLDQEKEHLRVPVEINPRFTMGTVAIGLAHRHRLGAFYFGARRDEEKELVEDFGALILSRHP